MSASAESVSRPAWPHDNLVESTQTLLAEHKMHRDSDARVQAALAKQQLSVLQLADELFASLHRESIDAVRSTRAPLLRVAKDGYLEKDKRVQNRFLASLVRALPAAYASTSAFALVLDADSLATSAALVARGFPADRIVVMNTFVGEQALTVQRNLALRGIRLVRSWSSLASTQCPLPPGPVFRFVYLDYTSTWSGRHECRPCEEVPALFAQRRFATPAVLAVTLVRRDGVHRQSMEQVAARDILSSAADAGYALRCLIPDSEQAQRAAGIAEVLDCGSGASSCDGDRDNADGDAADSERTGGVRCWRFQTAPLRFEEKRSLGQPMSLFVFEVTRTRDGDCDGVAADTCELGLQVDAKGSAVAPVPDSALKEPGADDPDVGRCYLVEGRPLRLLGKSAGGWKRFADATAACGERFVHLSKARLAAARVSGCDADRRSQTAAQSVAAKNGEERKVAAKADEAKQDADIGALFRVDGRELRLVAKLNGGWKVFEDGASPKGLLKRQLTQSALSSLRVN